MGDIYRERMLHGSSKPHTHQAKSLKRPCPSCNKEVTRSFSGKISNHKNGQKGCNASNLTDKKFSELWGAVLEARRSSFR